MYKPFKWNSRPKRIDVTPYELTSMSGTFPNKEIDDAD